MDSPFFYMQRDPVILQDEIQQQRHTVESVSEAPVSETSGDQKYNSRDGNQEKHNQENDDKLNQSLREIGKKWSYSDHQKVLLVYLYNDRQIEKIAARELQCSESQVRSHLQKYKTKVNQIESQYLTNFQQGRRFTQFQNEFNQCDSQKRRQLIIEFINDKVKQYITKDFPITLDIIFQAMYYFRHEYTEIPFDKVKRFGSSTMIKVSYAFAGQELPEQYMDDKNVIVFPRYNKKSMQLDVKQNPNLRLKSKKASQNFISEQFKDVDIVTFNCNFILQQCYQYLETTLFQFTFQSLLKLALVALNQVIDIGDNIDYAIKLQIKKLKQRNPYDPLSEEVLKQFIFCLLCAVKV